MCRSAQAFDFNSLTHLYFFAALDIHILELYVERLFLTIVFVK